MFLRFKQCRNGKHISFNRNHFFTSLLKAHCSQNTIKKWLLLNLMSSCPTTQHINRALILQVKGLFFFRAIKNRLHAQNSTQNIWPRMTLRFSAHQASGVFFIVG